jgi:phage virion morphogenesis protein
MNITIQVTDQAVRAVTRSLLAKLAKPEPLLKDLGEDVTQRAKQRFNTGIGPDGQRWKPKKKPNGRPTLVGDSGDLRRQIVWRVANGVLTVQATPRYAAIHQFGGTIERSPFSMLVRGTTGEMNPPHPGMQYRAR